MHIFRWLMSHPIITAWVLAALAILLNFRMGSGDEHKNVAHEKDNVPQVVHTEAEAKTEHGKAKVDKTVQITSEKVADGTKSAVVGDTVKAEETEGAENDKEVSEVENLPADTLEKPLEADKAVVAETKVAETKPAESAPVASDKSAPANAAESTVASVSGNETAEKKPTEASPESGTQANTTSNAQKPFEDLDALGSVELLQRAREAFWQNKKDESAKLYQMLVKRAPGSLAYKGELANVYWHQNKQEESAALYAEIAMPMLKSGKTKEVANMLGFIGVFFPEKAREIHRSMTTK